MVTASDIANLRLLAVALGIVCAPVATLALAAAPVAVVHPTAVAQSTARAVSAQTVTPAESSGLGSALVERGRYLARAGDCVSCHTRPGGTPFSGGVPFDTPLGTLYSSNITPDVESGIGKWTASDLRRAMHEGVAAGGYWLYPAFPYTSFAKVSDADVDAIYAYLRVLAPVRYRPPPNDVAFTQRWTMRFWNALFFQPKRFEANPARPPEWNRGAYLIEGLGHCSACHTPRNWLLAEDAGKAYSGGRFQDEVVAGKTRAWSAVNLTASRAGLAAWSVGDLTKYFKTGFCMRAGTFGPMNDVIVNSLSQLSTEDIHAMAVYLKSLPAQDTASSVAPPAARRGESIYQERCQKCHLTSGRGGMFNGPPLAGSAVVQSEDPASLINVILYGPQTPKEVSYGAWETMKPYRDVLSDVEVAAVSNYIRANWQNRGRTVTTADVAAQR